MVWDLGFDSWEPLSPTCDDACKMPNEIDIRDDDLREDERRKWAADNICILVIREGMG